MESIRTCIGCRERVAQRSLVRMSADSAGRIRIGVSQHIDGRSAYVHARQECVVESVRMGMVARSLRRKVQIVSGNELWLKILNRRVLSGSEKET